MAKVTSGQSLRFSLLCPRSGLLHARGDALEVGVREVVQGDGFAEPEDRLRLGKQVILQGFAVLVQRVRCAVKTAQFHRLEVKADQLAKRRVLLQPRVRGQFASRTGHAANDVAYRRGNL
jgi:hypothetical protein